MEIERRINIGGLNVEIRAVGIESMMTSLDELIAKLKEASNLIDDLSTKRMQLSVTNLFDSEPGRPDVE